MYGAWRGWERVVHARMFTGVWNTVIEHQTRDQKVRSPPGGAGKSSSPGSAFGADLYQGPSGTSTCFIFNVVY